MIEDNEEAVLLARLVDEPGGLHCLRRVAGEEARQVDEWDLKLWSIWAGLLLVGPYELLGYVLLVLKHRRVKNWWYACCGGCGSTNTFNCHVLFSHNIQYANPVGLVICFVLFLLLLWKISLNRFLQNLVISMQIKRDLRISLCLF
ncbi:hypothetical protein PanWU01x14_084200 [Parasponia andersonii]|uniref:Transmembrane protein n=1 Tax=Parasponia andersonii TaxID=3476 RepID=A0A2P5D9L0_PARAD|nr:hypothetical protein PanWU01x14_084200 [Parasponia andersonii]